MDFNARRKMTLSELQPDYTAEPPKAIRQTRRQHDVLYVAGEGPKDSGLMFVAPALEEDEAKEFQATTYGVAVKQPARYLKGDLGVVLRDSAMSVNLDIDKHYYTSFVKWLLPRNQRNKPPKEALAWAAPAFWQEIEECKPKFIVCLGKLAFDQLVDIKISASDALGGWFWSERAQARVFLMEKPYQLLAKPEKLEQFRLLFRDVRVMLETGGDVVKAPRDYRTISDEASLRALVAEWEAGDFRLQSLDCEWGGRNHLDGQLRSAQFAWKPGVGACIRFRDEQNRFAFEIDEEARLAEHRQRVGEIMLRGQGTPEGDAAARRQVDQLNEAYGTERAKYLYLGRILGRWLNRPDVKYVGHYIVADLPWIHTWLGLEWFDKCALDTAFAVQTADEHSPLGLEWLALAFTDLGRYDLELLLWRKSHPQREEDGYAYIPDRIIIPYSIGDVDVVFRAAPQIIHRLQMDGVWDYYQSIFHPFVTNVFTGFALHGLPMNEARMDELREVYQFAHAKLLAKFQLKVAAEARLKLMQKCQELFGLVAGTRLFKALDVPDSQGALANQQYVAEETRQTLLPFVKHLESSPSFNPWSKPQMVRWLFEVKGLTPIKSTDKKEKGIRAMSWDKVMALPPDKRADYTPATDKQTLQILSEGEPLVDELLDLTVTASICKAFLKEATIDDETGELTRENGLHYWLCSDGRVHAQLGTTETGRPRANRPNVLNWPSYVNKRISRAMCRLFRELKAAGELPPQFERYVPAEDKDEALVPSVRSCVMAVAEWCFVESDYQTAEIRALAFLSGDRNLIRLMTEPDASFGVVVVGGKKMGVRLYYESPTISGIPLADQDATLLMGVWKDGKKLQDVTADQLLRNDKGELVHPKHDLHWSLAEMVFCRPRELMLDKVHRQVGKTGNFKTAYGTSEASLDRGIEADTGRKPEPGTSKAILDALARRQPRATDFLLELENLPREKGCYVAASGRKRRFHRHPMMLSQDSWRMTKGLLSAMGREARNFPEQESVAATVSRAAIWLQKFGRDNGLEGYQIAVLYDSVVTHCPLYEREIWAMAHEYYMYLANCWQYDDRVLNYPIDTEFNVGWSERPPENVQAIWDDPKFAPTPPRLLPVLGWLRGQIAKIQNEQRTTTNAA